MTTAASFSTQHVWRTAWLYEPLKGSSVGRRWAGFRCDVCQRESRSAFQNATCLRTGLLVEEQPSVERAPSHRGLVLTRRCAQCDSEFTTGSTSARYCSDRCRTRAGNARRDNSKAGEWLRLPVTCICGVEFLRTKETGPGKKFCSDECRANARRRDVQKFLADHPTARREYTRNRVRGHGADIVMNRVRRRYPDVPTACECCGESRVLDLAHKPEFARLGAWRTMDKYERHMFWVLCPTCHRVLDGGIETPEQMGLRP